ncbi:hypothetical protein SAMN04488103_11633 [Gemmobacter aquatilis]|uniref:Sulfotransferase family protein n=2 Tax=Gemmobacter aquatilis TaxID=933059 RepID=A0A1H8N411_9RHOB|nr:hypothetical protein SAMN04488103_11633 [Gemmobacter aquatilis]
MKAVLHIGTEKTGTTTLQRFLDLNRKSLREAGILVPFSLGQTNHRLLAGIMNEDDHVDDLFRQMNLLDFAARKAAKRRWWEAFVKEVRRADLPRTVISSEHLQSRLLKETEIRRLQDHLSELFDEIRICIYLRSPAATAISLYSTAVKHGSTTGKLPPPNTPYFRSVIDHAATLRRWMAVFGKDNITVRLFDRQDFVNGDLIDDFMAACDLPASATQRPARENESLSALGIELLRRINRDIPVYLTDGTVNTGRSQMSAFFERHFSDGRRYIAEAETVAAYEHAFAESVEWVRQHFFPDRDQLFAPTPRDPATGEKLDNQDLQQTAAAIVELWQQAKSTGGAHAPT